MIFYSVLYFLVLFFLVFDFIEISLGLKKTFLILLMVIFTFVVGTSNGMGGDMPEYKYLFNDAPYLKDFVFGSYYKESGYVFLNSFFKTFFDSFNMMLFFITAVNFFFLYKILMYKPFQKYMFFSFYTYITGYMFAGMFGLLRQHIIMSIFLLGILALLESHKLKYILLVIFGMLFHRISAIYLFLLFFYKKKFTLSKYTLILFISLGLGITGLLFSVLIDTISFFSTAEIQEALRKVEGYYMAQMNDSTINLAFFEKFFLFFLFIYFYKEIVKLNSINYILINIFFLNIYIYLILIQDLGTAGRISKVFKIVEIVLIPQLFFIEMNRFLKYILFLFFVLLGALHYYKELFRNLEYFVPYSTVLGG